MIVLFVCCVFCFFQAEDGIRDLVRSRGLGDVYKRQDQLRSMTSDQAGDFIVTGESATEFFNDFLFQMVTIKYGGTPVGINEISALDEVVVYPNPSASGKYLFIDKSGQKGVSKARVFDASGKMIKEISNFDLHSEIDISQFPTGLYLFQYFRNDLPSGIIKLMKN